MWHNCKHGPRFANHSFYSQFTKHSITLGIGDVIEIKWLTWQMKNIPFFSLQIILGCACSMLSVIIHPYCEVLSYQFCKWLIVSREFKIYAPQNSYWHFYQLPSQPRPSHTQPSPSLTHEVVLWTKGCYFAVILLPRTFLFPFLLILLYKGFILQRNLIPELRRQL